MRNLNEDHAYFPSQQAIWWTEGSHMVGVTLRLEFDNAVPYTGKNE